MLLSKEKNSPYKIALFAAIPILTLLSQVIPLISADPLLEFDDLILIRSVQSESVLSYFQKLLSLNAIDIQPVRDLLILGEIRFSKIFFSPFHLVNVFLVATACFFWFRITKKWVTTQGHAWTAMTLALIWVLSHGAWVFSLSWVAAQKHWLALIFLLLAIDCARLETHQQQQRLSVSKLSVFFAVLGMLSHPILCLVGLLPFLFSWFSKSRPKLISPTTTLALLSLLLLGLNYHYYQSIYPGLVGFAKFQPAYDFTFVSTLLLRFGRYFFNLVCPAFIAVTYSPASWQNIVGIPIAVVMGYALLKLLPRLQALVVGALICIPFFATAPFQQGIFLSDTYLLFPVAVVGWLLARLVNEVPRAGFIAAVLIIVNLATSFSIPESFKSDTNLWIRSYQVEPDHNSLLSVIYAQLQRGLLNEARYNLEIAQEWIPESALLKDYWCDLHRQDVQKPARERIEKLETLVKSSDSYSCREALIILLLAEKRDKDAISIAMNVGRLNVTDSRHTAENLSARLYIACTNEKIENCELIKERWVDLSRRRILPWNEAVYQTALKNITDAKIRDAINRE